MLNINSSNYRTIKLLVLRYCDHSIRKLQRQNNLLTSIVYLILWLSQTITYFTAALLCKLCRSLSRLEMTNQIEISHSLYTPVLGQTILIFKGWQPGRVHMNCQSSLYFPLMFKNSTISLISCQSSLQESILTNLCCISRMVYMTCLEF
jgi:hypothetical protein